MTLIQDKTLRTLSALLSQEMEPGSVPTEQWGDIIGSALKHDLGPMLYWVIKRRGSDGLSADGLWQALRESAVKTAARHAILEDALTRINKAFEEAGVPAVWLKGADLARTVYPDPHLRPMEDLDVLIPKEKSETARKAAETAGFCMKKDPGHLLRQDDVLKTKLSHHFELEGGLGNVVALELHFWLLSGQEGWLAGQQLEWFWKQTRIVETGGNGLRILKPEANLLYLIAHAALQHGEGQFLLLRYFDLHLLISKTDMDWQLVIDQAISLKWAYAAEMTLVRTRDLFNTPVPSWVLEQLDAVRAADEDVSRVTRLGESGVRWEKMQRTLSELSAMDGARHALRVVFPPPEYMRIHYGVEPDSSVIPSYVHRWRDQASEILKWLGNRFAEK